MPDFYFHFFDGQEMRPNDIPLHCENLEQAFLRVCEAIPDMAQDLLLKRKDPLAAFFTIVDGKGQRLMSVPFTEVLRPSEWRRPKARRRPHGGPRSVRARDALALTSFRQMFGSVNAGCVLMTPEMRIVEMNTFGARHSHVNAEVIRGQSIYDIFAELCGEPKAHFAKFMGLAQAGAASQVTDLPYLVLDANGQTTNGWWNARTWPIYDDAGHVLGFVEWAEPFTAPTQGGKTLVRLIEQSV